MKKILFLVLFIFSILMEGKVASFPTINKADSILVSKDKIYINEKFSISIYSLRDFTLINKFGREGEGPQEFKFSTHLYLFEDNLVVVSLDKISYYDEFGNFIKERRCILRSLLFSGSFLPNDFFVSIDSFSAPKRTISLYDSEFKKVKEICKGCSGFHKGDILGNKTLLQTYKDKIFLVRGNEFIVDVFDSNGVKLYSITEEYERIKFSQEDKEDFLKSFKANPYSRDFFKIVKDTAKFPVYLPAIKKISIANDKVYIQTFKRSSGKYEFYIFDIHGKLIKRLFLPIYQMYKGFTFLYPFTIQNEKLYQLVENEESDVWELHITEIKL